MSVSKLYKVTLVIEEEVLATDEAEAFRFVVQTAMQTPWPRVGLDVAELLMGTGDVYEDGED